MDNSICIVCKKPCKHVLKHLAKSLNCKANYPQQALDELQKNSKINSKARNSQRKQETYVSEVESKRKRETYDSVKESKRKKENYDSVKESERKKLHYKEETHARKEGMKTFNEHMFKKFFEEIQYGPIFPCICCMKCFTLRGVRIMHSNYHQKLKDAKVTEFITLNDSLKMNDNFHLCHTCFLKLPNRKMPKLCFKNELQLAKVPKCLKITSLGNQLLAKYILFIKIRRTSKDTMDLINDRVSQEDLPIIHCLHIQN